MIKYTWRINTITKKTISDTDSVIFNVVWEKFGIDEDGHSGVYKISTRLNTSDINSDNFIAYEDLSEDIVIGWIKSVINEEEVDKYIQNEIKRAKDKEIQVENGNFPWQIS